MSDESEAEKYWVKLLGQANVALQGASDAELRVQLFDTLEEFFDGSNCWQESIPFTFVPDMLEYTLIPQSGRVLRLYGVVDQNNSLLAAAMPEIGTVRFAYPANEPQAVLAIVVKTATDPLSCFPPNIPEWLLPAHGLGLLHGLLGNMMLQPGQSYSNPQMAQFHLQKFRDAVAHARVATMRANTVGSQSWAFPQQFRVSGQRGGVSTFNMHPVPLPR